MARTHWRSLLRRVKEQAVRDRLSLVAAGVAFYALLAAFPALAALVALYGLLFDPQQIADQLSTLQYVVPQQAIDVLLPQLQGLSLTGRGTLGWGAAGALLLTLWSASKGVRTLVEALNVAYDEHEQRGFIARQALVLLLTLGAVVGAAVAIAAVVLLPGVIGLLGLAPLLEGLVSYGRWPILATAVAVALAVVYRYGPSREHPSWAVVRWGAIVATALWLAGSTLFSFYVSNFGSFNQTYGSIAAVVILLIWFLLSAYVVLLGAELNVVLEGELRRNASPSAQGRTPATSAA